MIIFLVLFRCCVLWREFPFAFVSPAFMISSIFILYKFYTTVLYILYIFIQSLNFIYLYIFKQVYTTLSYCIILNGLFFLVTPELSSKIKTNIVMRSGKDVFIPCAAAAGLPVPRVFLTKIKPKGPFPAALEKRIVYQNHLIGIKRLKINDSGLYSCSAKNIVGRVNVTIKLNVIGTLLEKIFANFRFQL